MRSRLIKALNNRFYVKFMQTRDRSIVFDIVISSLCSIHNAMVLLSPRYGACHDILPQGILINFYDGGDHVRPFSQTPKYVDQIFQRPQIC